MHRCAVLPCNQHVQQSIRQHLIISDAQDMHCFKQGCTVAKFLFQSGSEPCGGVCERMSFLGEDFLTGCICIWTSAEMTMSVGP